MKQHAYNIPSVKALESAFPSKGKSLRTALESAKGRLDKCDEILGGFGVEEIRHGHNLKSPFIKYVNMGDTYATTIMFVKYKHSLGHYVVGNWGYYVERGNYD